MQLQGENAHSHRNPLTDSGVMRILGDYEPEIATPPASLNHPRRQSAMKNCPRCQNELIDSARVCIYCNLYLSPATGQWRSAYRAACRRARRAK